MKYPQLVSMPSAVQDWLDEQLEARGIDAVVYTRYVVSLLQRDTLERPEELFSLSPSKSKGDAGRRSRKRGRRDEACWNAWDKERLRRTAAVECLMSASDQKCGIEKLVDELCIKLNEIQSEGDNTVHLDIVENKKITDQSSQLSSLSPQDLVQKYYDAFPPLSSKSTLTNSTSFIPIANTTSSAWSRRVVFDTFGKTKNQEFDKVQKNTTLLELSSPIKEKEELEESTEMEMQCQDNISMVDNGKDEEPGLAQLIAKFDESIEALWADDNENSCKQSGHGTTSSTLATPPLIRPSPGDSIFLHRGTNITSSIWSQAPDPPILQSKVTHTWSNADISCSSMLRNYTNFGFSFNETETFVGGIENVGEKKSRYFGRERGWHILNHSAEDSCFTAVVPGAGRLDSVAVAPPTITLSSNSPLQKKTGEKEENLLTSTRTHFRPIRHESLGWADGTSFIIPNSLESVSFRRSESGILYLDADARYMEYKEKEPYGGRNQPYGGRNQPYGGRNQIVKPTPSPNLSSLTPSPTTPFIPKFRVRQNEKCIQTDSDGELVSKRSRQDEMYFPGDEQALAGCLDETDNSLYEECKCQPWTPKYVPNRVWDNTQLPWTDVWGSPQKTCRACNSSGRPHSEEDQSALKLREELSEDGEQLLSDLSYYQLYLGSEWLDESTLSNKALDSSYSPMDEYSSNITLIKDPPGLLKLSSEIDKQSQLAKTKFQNFISMYQSAANKFPNSLNSLETEIKPIERPLTINLASQKDRKRRHSASLRVEVPTASSSMATPKPRTAVPSTVSDDTQPTAIWSDDISSCSNGIKCLLLPHQAEKVLRSVTL